MLQKIPQKTWQLILISRSFYKKIDKTQQIGKANLEIYVKKLNINQWKKQQELPGQTLKPSRFNSSCAYVLVKGTVIIVGIGARQGTNSSRVAFTTFAHFDLIEEINSW